MRVYETSLPKLALFDLPATKYDQAKYGSYVEKIFKQLLVFDTEPDDDFPGVLDEAEQTTAIQDPAFAILFSNDFERYITSGRHHARWQKIQKDYNYYIDWETKRRNKENPYYSEIIFEPGARDEIPDFSKERKNLPYQFDYLYRHSKEFEEKIRELTKDYQSARDKDLFRARINSLLVPNKIIFALKDGEAGPNFSAGEIAVVNLKIMLDALKLASVFLDKTIDSLHKMRWSAAETGPALDEAIDLGGQVLAELKSRIFQTERRFIMYLESDLSQG